MFWIFLIGIALGVGLLYLTTRPGVKLQWFDYVLVALGVIFGFLALQNFFASFQELEPTAAWFLLASFGIPALILLGLVAFRLVRGGGETAAKVETPEKAAGD